MKQGEKWLVRSDNLHGASFLGGRDEHMVRRCSSASMALPAGGLHYTPAYRSGEAHSN